MIFDASPILRYSVGARPRQKAEQGDVVSEQIAVADPSTWDPALDAVTAAPANHRILFENDRLRVLEVTLEPDDEEPVHHHRWPSGEMSWMGPWTWSKTKTDGQRW